MFADEWSQYLIEQLPKNKPITSFTELDEWVDSIWESFYNEHEEKAKQGDGILLNKFYGSRTIYQNRPGNAGKDSES